MIPANQLDDLTCLMVRSEFMAGVAPLLAAHLEEGTEISLGFLDIDGFAETNGKLGHSGADEFMRQTASILRRNARSGDVLGRYGGDEFAIVFPSTAAETAFILLEEIRELVEETVFEIPLPKKKEVVRSTLSIGLASCPRDARTLEELIRKADQALYRAKKEGRNRICLAQEEKMASKSNYYTSSQLERLSGLSKQTRKSEAFLLREALDLLLQKYEDHKEGYHR